MVNLKTNIFIILTLCFCVNFSFTASERADHRQRGAKVDYFNPKYVNESVAFTARTKRNRPYLTNITLTTLVTMSNNVTVHLQHNMRHSPLDFEIVKKACDFVRIKWIQDYILKFSDLDPNKCPYTAKTYHMYNMMFEADKILIPMPKGSNEITFILEGTDTRELIAKISLSVDIF